MASYALQNVRGQRFMLACVQQNKPDEAWTVMYITANAMRPAIMNICLHDSRAQ